MANLISVKNMTDTIVVFKDDDTNRRFKFEPQEKKQIDEETLRRLNYSYGGNVLLRNYLCVADKGLREEFGVPSDQIEYDYTKQDVDSLILRTDSTSIEEIADLLDFAPDGIIELLIDRMISLECPDARKRELVAKMTGKDINNMININHMVEEPVEETTTKRQRRVSNKQASTSGRRVAKKEATE